MAGKKPASKKTGGSMGGRLQMSEGRRRRAAKARQQEEQEWQAKAGPVVVTRATPEQLEGRVRQSRSAGPMGDRRTKRSRVRAAQERAAVREQEDE